MEILIGSVGVISVVWSFVTFVDLMRQGPRFVFDFEDGVLEFDIESPGFYSIAVWGAGYIGKLSHVRTGLQTASHDPLNVKRYIVSPRMQIEGKLTTGCWYFVTERSGCHKLFFSNLEATKAKESMLPASRAFQNSIDKSRLRLIIHKSIRPLYQVLASLGLPFGILMIFASFTLDF